MSGSAQVSRSSNLTRPGSWEGIRVSCSSACANQLAVKASHHEPKGSPVRGQTAGRAAPNTLRLAQAQQIDQFQFSDKWIARGTLVWSGYPTERVRRVESIGQPTQAVTPIPNAGIPWEEDTGIRRLREHVV